MGTVQAFSHLQVLSKQESFHLSQLLQKQVEDQEHVMRLKDELALEKEARMLLEIEALKREQEVSRLLHDYSTNHVSFSSSARRRDQGSML